MVAGGVNQAKGDPTVSSKINDASHQRSHGHEPVDAVGG